MEDIKQEKKEEKKDEVLEDIEEIEEIEDTPKKDEIKISDLIKETLRTTGYTQALKNENTITFSPFS